MKKIVLFFLCFLCSIFCFADTWEGIYTQSTETEPWKEIKVQGEPPVARHNHSMVAYDGKYYIACGRSEENNRLSDIWCVDITNPSQTFTKIYESDGSDGFYGVCGHATLVLNNKLYILFGYHKNNIHSIFSYDFTATGTEKKWTKEYDETIAGDDFTPRENFAVAAINNDIYVFGGVRAGTMDDLITDDQIFGYFSYDSDKETWVFTTIPLSRNAPQPRKGHSMVSIGDTLYLFGGWDRDSNIKYHTLWKYDKNNNSWQEINTGQSKSKIPAARSFHIMHSHLNKELWILGGRDIHNGFLNDVWKFDIVENKWIKKGKAPIDLYFSRAGSVLQEGENMKIYIWGGMKTKEGSDDTFLPADIIYECTYTGEEEEEEIETEPWKEIKVQSELPVARHNHSMVAYDGKYYIACGRSKEDTPLSDIWCIDITNPNPTFTKIYESEGSDEFLGVCSHATLVLNNKLYVLFGNMWDDNNQRIHSIFSYDFTATGTEKKWIQEYDATIAEDDFTPRANFAVAAINNDIYVFGGVVAGTSNDLITDDQIFGYFSYDSDKGTWIFTKIPLSRNAPQPRKGHSMVSIGDTLYLFGGWDKNSKIKYHTLWKYDKNNNSWQEINTGQSKSKIPAARSSHIMHSHLNKELWILGGQDIHKGFLNDVWKFDIVENKWIEKENAPIDLYFAQAGSVLQEGENMKIYIWGGKKTTEGSSDDTFLPADTIYEYTYTDKEEEEEEEEEDNETGKSGCGLLGIEFVILALLSLKIRRK
ncbi:MAG TPA: kelch repeat-containing protein [Planctomycetota bacterium]|nr:kelch repeat-containing protein [Planctomycetota bacterium]